MSKATNPGDVPEIPQESPLPAKAPEITPTVDPENPQIPEENPGALPEPEPIQPEIPTEIPPSLQ